MAEPTRSSGRAGAPNEAKPLSPLRWLKEQARPTPGIGLYKSISRVGSALPSGRTTCTAQGGYALLIAGDAPLGPNGWTPRLKGEWASHGECQSAAISVITGWTRERTKAARLSSRGRARTASCSGGDPVTATCQPRLEAGKAYAGARGGRERDMGMRMAGAMLAGWALSAASPASGQTPAAPVTTPIRGTGTTVTGQPLRSRRRPFSLSPIASRSRRAGSSRPTSTLVALRLCRVRRDPGDQPRAGTVSDSRRDK